ncbi:MAG TPA: DUF3450 domain-containing protein [Steroidobacteraceae bacterium]|nr:DUF3450 domain-containing protein [Steroidobacteraceae bacterium]
MSHHVLIVLVLLSTSFATLAADPATTVEDAVRTDARSLERSRATQARIDQMDDETRTAVAEYSGVVREIGELAAYNEQLSTMIATQLEELGQFDEQLSRIEETQRQIVPLMTRMIEVLEEFVRLDAPFLPEERRLRLEELRSLMSRADVAISDKFRRLIEAYQIEAEYGQTIEAYRDEIDVAGERRSVEVLRFGRTGLYYRTLDGELLGHWDRVNARWEPMSSASRDALDHALRVARRQLPPDLVVLPVTAAPRSTP